MKKPFVILKLATILQLEKYLFGNIFFLLLSSHLPAHSLAFLKNSYILEKFNGKFYMSYN